MSRRAVISIKVKIYYIVGMAKGGYETRVSKLFILIDKILQESLLRGKLVHGINIDLSELLNVDWSSVLNPVSIAMDDNMGDMGALSVSW